MNDRAATERHGDNVRHAEVRLHAAELDAEGRLARKAAADCADIGTRATDVDHERVGEARQDTSAANRVGSTATDRQHGQLARLLDRHQRAVVLREKGRGRKTTARERLLETVDHTTRHATECGIEDRGVLALQQTDAADQMPERNAHDVTKLGAHKHRSLVLLRGVLHGEHACDRDRIDRPARCEHAADLLGIERVGTSVDLDAAPYDRTPAIDRSAQVGGPVGEKRHRQRGGRSKPQHRDAAEFATAQDRVERMRGTERGDAHRAAIVGRHRCEGRGDAIQRICGCRRLAASKQCIVGAEQHGVGIRPTDVDTDAQHTHRANSSTGRQGPG